MMLRVIPTLLLSGRGLVKTRRFADPVYVGDPRNVDRIFDEKEVDELLLFDICASKDDREPDYGLVQDIVTEAFMPVCFGGGVRSVEQARRLLRLGVEKIAVNTAALADRTLVPRLSAEFGAQCVVAALDVKRDLLGRPRVFSHAGARVPEPDPVRWAQRLVAEGAGEVLVQSVDREGTQSGFDLELLRSFNGKIGKPLIAGGGAGTLAHMDQALRACRLSGLSVGARFVFFGPHRAVLVRYLEPPELARLSALARSEGR
jgi:cyclase